jgi:hypothetical protein
MNDFFDDLPHRSTLKQFFAQVGPRTGPPPAYLRKPEPAPEFAQPERHNRAISHSKAAPHQLSHQDRAIGRLGRIVP